LPDGITCSNRDGGAAKTAKVEAAKAVLDYAMQRGKPETTPQQGKW